MNAPRDLGPDFRAWLRDTPPMPDELPRRTLDQTRHTRQRRRWLWFLPGPKPTAGADDQDDRTQPMAPLTTTGGPIPAPTGGIRTMISPAKLVAAAAAVALFGALLVSPMTPEAEVAPPATTTSDLPAVTLVSGQMSVLRPDDYGATEAHDWGYSVTDALWTTELELSDERLSGPARLRANVHARSGSEWGPNAFSVFLESDGGSWVGTGHGYMDPYATEGSRAAGLHLQVILEGQDGYEGLNAIMALDQPDSNSSFEATGAIMALDLPPIPGAAPRTFASDGE